MPFYLLFIVLCCSLSIGGQTSDSQDDLTFVVHNASQIYQANHKRSYDIFVQDHAPSAAPDTLPDEIIVNILYHLDLQDLCAASYLNHQWHACAQEGAVCML